MTIKSITSTGVVGYDIMDVNLNEMRQMCELEQRIAEVLFSHINKVDANGKAIKPQYLNDDELRMMRAILHTFTKNYQTVSSSSFDATLKELKEQENPAPQAKIPIGDDQLFG